MGDIGMRGLKGCYASLHASGARSEMFESSKGDGSGEERQYFKAVAVLAFLL